MSARRGVVVGVVAGVAALASGAVLAWRRWGSGAAADGVSPDNAAAVDPPGDPAMPIVSLPVRVTSRADFVAQLREAMSIELPQLNREGRQLLVAHAAYESGYGGALGGRTGRAFRMGWDFGNIVRGYKGAGSTWDGASWKDAGGDTDGAGNPIDQEWRIYTDLRDAVRDYWAFLGWSRYIAARNILEASTGLDSDQFAAELKKGGYFGLSLPKYQAGLATTLAQVASGWGA